MRPVALLTLTRLFVINSAIGKGGAIRSNVIANERMVSHCVQCDILVSRYESASFELAKIHSDMDAAECQYDKAVSRRLTLQAYEAADRRRKARSALARHQDTDHNDISQLAVSVSVPSSNR